MAESINYNKIITKGLGPASQKLRRKGGEEKTYPDPVGFKIALNG